MTRVSRSTSAIASSKTLTSSSSKNSRIRTEASKESKISKQRDLKSCDIDKLKSLFQNDPEGAIQLLNQRIIKSHPLGCMLNEASCKIIINKVSKILSEDKDSTEYLHKLLGG